MNKINKRREYFNLYRPKYIYFIYIGSVKSHLRNFPGNGDRRVAILVSCAYKMIFELINNISIILILN